MKWREGKVKCSKCFTRQFKDFETHFFCMCFSNQQPKTYSPLTFYFSTTSFWIFFFLLLLFSFFFSKTFSHFVFSLLWELFLNFIFVHHSSFWFSQLLFFFTTPTLFYLDTPTLAILYNPKTSRAQKKQEVTIIVLLTFRNKGRLVFKLVTWIRIFVS